MTYAYIFLDGWGGASKQKVELVGETPKKYRIRAIELTKLAGRSRWLPPGQETLVPKTAVVVERTPDIHSRSSTKEK